MPSVSSQEPACPDLPHAGGAATRRSRAIEGSPVYYGWVILAASTLGMMMTTPGQTFAVSAFLDAIIQDLDLKRSTVSLMYSLGTLAGSLAMPRLGRWIDEVGPRRAVAVISALFALACVGMSRVSGPWTLLLGFTGIRGLGQGGLGVVSLHVVNLWFVRRRGFAVGVSGTGMAAASALFPLGIAFLIARMGWRDTYALLGAIIALTILPVGALLFRDAPEHFGLRPDGHTADENAEPLVEAKWTLAEARRTAMFWMLVAGSFLPAALLTGLIFHHFSIMGINGISRVDAATAFVPMAVVAALSNLGTGVLLDRLPPQRLVSASLWLLAATLLAATRITGAQGAWLYGVLLGVMQGTQVALSGTVWAHYFGRTHHGAIRGFAFTLMVGGSAFGPLPFAWGVEAFGSYAPLLTASALLPAAAAVWALVVPEPKKAAGRRGGSM